MAGTGITVVLVVVMIQVIFASTLTDVDSHQLAAKEAKETPLKRNSYGNEYGCYDNHDNCEYWASCGKCNNNPGFMHSNCRSSCGVCSNGGCYDNHNRCGYWASMGHCNSNRGYMFNNCARSCGQCSGGRYFSGGRNFPGGRYFFGGMDFKRDVTRNLGNSPREQVRADDKLKRMYGKGFQGGRTWSQSYGYNRPPFARKTESN